MSESVWQPDVILESLAHALRDADGAFAAEQATRGLDALDEVGLHPLLAAGLDAAGFGVLREQPYPSQNDPALLPRDRERCDLVLLPEPGMVLLDPLDARREEIDRAASLFAAAPPPAPPANGVTPEDACWLEVKAVAQYAYVEGVPGPNRTYASQLIGALRTDARKMAEDALIECAAVLVVLFTETPEVAAHDADAAVVRALDQHAPIADPRRVGIAITERAGNAWCELLLARVRR